MRHKHADLIKEWCEEPTLHLQYFDEKKWITFPLSSDGTCNPDWSQGIIRICREPDIIDWWQVNPRYNYMARDQDDEAYLYEHKPASTRIGWGTTQGDAVSAEVFLSYKKGTVHWTDSLVERP